ncbi:FecR family protein [Halalkalibaculum sp. DA384]|uniref:FecR family protein n=1 Tax=Halalkalibaculum sp. DA384 TaxID=3373606 RepID=UPI00375427AE
MDLEKVERFFRNTCSAEEAGAVLDWFSKPEGKAFLKKKLDQDIDLLKDERITPLMSEIRSEKMWDTIESGIEATPTDKYLTPSGRKSNYYWQVAAVALVVLVSSVVVFSNWADMNQQSQVAEQPVLYKAGEDQHKLLSLSDGTKIRLNSNAQIQISEGYGRSEREVTLTGEAYFEVIHDETRPFVIHTPGASIKDLGTAFNVKADPDEDNVQVAVTEGKVSMWTERQNEEEATELVPGQFGYIDLEQRTIQVDEFGVNNYLSWMNKRLEFNEAPLDKVSLQLSRIFDLSFNYSDEELKRLTLSTDFQYGSVEKVLEVVSMTLHIDYERKDNSVIWVKDNVKS